MVVAWTKVDKWHLSTVQSYRSGLWDCVQISCADCCDAVWMIARLSRRDPTTSAKIVNRFSFNLRYKTTQTALAYKTETTIQLPDWNYVGWIILLPLVPLLFYIVRYSASMF